MLNPEHTPHAETQPNLEIERKFMVESLPPNLSEYNFEFIRQGYMVIGQDGSETELRNYDGNYSLSVKPTGGVSLSEHEAPLTEDQFRLLKGYMALDQDNLEIRLRSYDDSRYNLTVKSTGGLKRDEYEMPLTEDQFRLLWPTTDGKRLTKYRFYIPHGEATIELDIYKGILNTLKIAEVEFENEAAAQEFVPPEWFDAEVTEDPVYKNQHLAVFGPPK